MQKAKLTSDAITRALTSQGYKVRTIKPRISASFSFPKGLSCTTVCHFFPPLCTASCHTI